MKLTAAPEWRATIDRLLACAFQALTSAGMMVEAGVPGTDQMRAKTYRFTDSTPGGLIAHHGSSSETHRNTKLS